MAPDPGNATRRTPARWTLGTAVLLSLAVHVGAAYALGLLPARTPGATQQDARPDPLELDARVPFVTLGEREKAPLSLTWLALPEPENHAAIEPTETVQPRLRDEEASPVVGPDTDATGPGRTLTASEAQAIRDLARQLRAVRMDAVDALVREANTLVRVPASVLDLLARTRPTEPETTQVAQTPEDQTTPASASTPGGGAETPAPEARVTDREADPTSTIVAIVDDIGSDLVSQGVTLRTFRPVVPPGMPFASGSVVFDIAFDADGRAYAEVVEPSNHRQWDDLYKNVIYDKWIAAGPAIEDLAGTKDRVRVRLQINYSNIRR